MKIEVDTHDEPAHLRALAVMLEAIAGEKRPAKTDRPLFDQPIAAAAVVQMPKFIQQLGQATAPLPEPTAAEAFALTPPPVVLDVPAAAPAAVIPPPPPPVADGAEELDSAGHAWNADIHASSKAKVADGTWRKRRGGPSETAEAAAPVAPPAPPAPSAPPAPPATVAEAGAVTFTEAMVKITAAMGAGKITFEGVAAACQNNGLPAGLPSLSEHPGKVAAVLATLGLS